jgi:septum formation topological specificity factor MinE
MDAKKKRLDAAVAEERRREAEYLEALQSKASADALRTLVAQ